MLDLREASLSVFILDLCEERWSDQYAHMEEATHAGESSDLLLEL